jgi:hypothetical protein
MAFYSLSLTVAASTSPDAPATAEVEIFPGVVTHVWLQFPRGCAGLVHARVLRAGSQIWPANPDADIASDGFIVNWSDEYDMTDTPLTLTLSAYNLDDTYPHTVTLWLETRPVEDYQAAQQTQNLLGKFLELVGVR